VSCECGIAQSLHRGGANCWFETADQHPGERAELAEITANWYPLPNDSTRELISACERAVTPRFEACG